MATNYFPGANQLLFQQLAQGPDLKRLTAPMPPGPGPQQLTQPTKPGQPIIDPLPPQQPQIPPTLPTPPGQPPTGPPTPAPPGAPAGGGDINQLLQILLQQLFGNIQGLGPLGQLGQLTPQQLQQLQSQAFAGVGSLQEILGGQLGSAQSLLQGALQGARQRTAADISGQERLLRGAYEENLRGANERAVAQGLAGPGGSSIEAAQQAIAGRDLMRSLETLSTNRQQQLAALESEGLGNLGALARTGQAEMGALGREAAGRLSGYQFQFPFQEREYQTGLQNQLLGQMLGIGQFSGGLGIEQERLKLQRELGLGGLALQGEQLDIQRGLGEADLQLRRDLGFSNIGLEREHLDIVREQVNNDFDLRNRMLEFEQHREEFNQLATMQQLGLSQQEINLAEQQMQLNYGLSREQMIWGRLMSRLESLYRFVDPRDDGDRSWYRNVAEGLTRNAEQDIARERAAGYPGGGEGEQLNPIQAALQGAQGSQLNLPPVQGG